MNIVVIFYKWHKIMTVKGLMQFFILHTLERENEVGGDKDYGKEV